MTAADLLLATALDAVAGDPRWLPHPVRWMGRIISWYDQRIRALCRTDEALRIAGAVLAVGLSAIAFAIGTFTISQAESVSPWFGQAVGIIIAYTTLAGRDLLDHVGVIGRELAQGNLSNARKAVAMIVGRDSMTLEESEIVRATVETMAESASDGIIAPIVYLTLGGPALALAYKAINTLDSMIGHRDSRYEHFGWAAARLDDVANWVPARLTGAFIAMAAGLATWQWERARFSWFILHRDGDKHASPNSGRPEAALAGALGVQLGGRNFYDGVPEDRPLIGEGTSVLNLNHIAQARDITVVTWGLGVFFALLSLWR